MNPARNQQFVKVLRDSGVRFVELVFLDIQGTPKSKTVPIDRVEHVLDVNGTWTDGSSIRGLTRQHESDIWLRLDLPDDPKDWGRRVFVESWGDAETKTAIILTDVCSADGELFLLSPRSAHKVYAERIEKERGFYLQAGWEPEFYLLKPEDEGWRIAPHDSGGYYSLGPIDRADTIRKTVMAHAMEFGVPTDASHHEVGAGQHEIEPRYTKAVDAADRFWLFKHVVRSVAFEKFALVATFMPKPFADRPGNGSHVHLSVADRNGRNLFYDPDDRRGYKLSKFAYHFVAGLVHHAPALVGVICPTVNSYKRHDPAFEAPTDIVWARTHRGAFIRIPACQAAEVEKGARVELRATDPTCNPHLTLLAVLACGLDGVDRELDPGEPFNEDVHHLSAEVRAKRAIRQLPRNVAEATDSLEKSDVLRKAMGDSLFQALLVSNRAQWQEYCDTVPREEREGATKRISNWELQTYLHF
jgi:glutamine synthetase